MSQIEITNIFNGVQRVSTERVVCVCLEALLLAILIFRSKLIIELSLISFYNIVIISN